MGHILSSHFICNQLWLCIKIQISDNGHHDNEDTEILLYMEMTLNITIKNFTQIDQKFKEIFSEISRNFPNFSHLSIFSKFSFFNFLSAFSTSRISSQFSVQSFKIMAVLDSNSIFLSKKS